MVGFPRFFSLYRGYANSDRAQIAGNQSRLAEALAKGTASAVVPPSGDSASGWAYRPARGTTTTRVFGRPFSTSERGKLYRIEITGRRVPGYPSIRRSNRAIVVSYENLSATLQKINKEGGKVSSITPA